MDPSTKVKWNETCPFITTDDMGQWEVQEVRSAWQNAMRTLEQLEEATEGLRERLRNPRAHAKEQTFESYVRLVPDEFRGGGGSVLHSYAGDAESAVLKLRSILDSIRYRRIIGTEGR